MNTTNLQKKRDTDLAATIVKTLVTEDKMGAVMELGAIVCGLLILSHAFWKATDRLIERFDE